MCLSFKTRFQNVYVFRHHQVDGKFKLCQVAPVAVPSSSLPAVRTPEILKQSIRKPAAINGRRQWPRRSSRRETENIQISILFQNPNKQQAKRPGDLIHGTNALFKPQKSVAGVNGVFWSFISGQLLDLLFLYIKKLKIKLKRLRTGRFVYRWGRKAGQIKQKRVFNIRL